MSSLGVVFRSHVNVILPLQQKKLISLPSGFATELPSWQLPNIFWLLVDYHSGQDAGEDDTMIGHERIIL
jgi:hypothetical protein